MADIKIEDYLPFVKNVVSKYRNMGLPYDDLLQEGLMGLWEAAERYDPSHGTKLTTYAVFWIKKRVIMALEKEHRIDPGMAEINEAITPAKEDQGNATQVDKISLPEDMPESEKIVLRLSFEKQYTLNEIANIMKITRERARQYKEKGLRRLRSFLN